jgi:hypothetical protein
LTLSDERRRSPVAAGDDRDSPQRLSAKQGELLARVEAQFEVTCFCHRSILVDVRLNLLKDPAVQMTAMSALRVPWQWPDTAI